jgi:hypothetical protein
LLHYIKTVKIFNAALKVIVHREGVLKLNALKNTPWKLLSAFDA